MIKPTRIEGIVGMILSLPITYEWIIYIYHHTPYHSGMMLALLVDYPITISINKKINIYYGWG